jgi:hypothetical protein
MTRILLLLALFACGGSDPVAAGDPAAVGALAKEIDAAPDKAEALLAEHGLDADKFETILYDIAADPERSKVYLEARGK